MNPFRLLFLSCFIQTILFAQSPSLVKDVFPGVSDNSIRDLVPFAGGIYFVADDNLHGYELWKSDGTEAGTILVKDLNPGNGSALIGFPTVVGNTVFFSAYVQGLGYELWKSDGTDSGTLLVKDIEEGSDSSNPTELTAVSGQLFFSAYSDTNGLELWKSDGTEAGTTLVKNINAMPNWHSEPLFLANMNGTLYFIADDGIHGREPWKSDGTEAGTVMIKDIFSGNENSMDGYYGNEQFFCTQSTVYFIANDGIHGRELWKTDGTEAGTTLVREIYPGIFNGFPLGFQDMIVMNDMLYFFTVDPTSNNNWGIWKTDGTETGTVPVRMTCNVDCNWPSTNSVLINNNIYFGSYSEPDGNELWKSDGTEAETNQVKNIHLTGSSLPAPNVFIRIGETLYFSADEGINGQELWLSDGTENGTMLVHDIAPGIVSSLPNSFTESNGTLYFTADDGVHGRELWRLEPNVELPDVNSLNNFQIYPNPAKNKINIIGQINDPIQIKLLSINGRVVQQLISQDGTTEMVLNLPNGMYFVEISSLETGIELIKLLIN